MIRLHNAQDPAAQANRIRPAHQGTDSFRQAVELVAHAELGTDHGRLKHAIKSAHLMEQTGRRD